MRLMLKMIITIDIIVHRNNIFDASSVSNLYFSKKSRVSTVGGVMDSIETVMASAPSKNVESQTPRTGERMNLVAKTMANILKNFFSLEK